MSLFDALAGNLPIVAGAAILAVGGIAYFQMQKGGNSNPGSGGAKKSILVFSPKDKRGKEIKIKEETETRLDCGKVGSVDVRFYKTGPGWNFPNGVTKFLGIEGTAYTALAIDDKPRNVTLSEALRVLWGPAAYEKMPQALKDPLEKHRFGVTIQPERVPEEDKAMKITAEDRDKENIKVGMEELRKNMQKKGKIDWVQAASFIAIGILVGVFLVNWNVIKLA